MTLTITPNKINKKQLNSNKSKQNILNAASRLFANKGFDGTTSKEIAQLAECSEGLIFKYFKDKKNLFNTLLIDWFDNHLERLDLLSASETLEEEIYLLVSWFFNTYNQQRDLHKMFIGQRVNSNTHDELNDYRNEYVQKRAETISTRLLKYQLAGQLQKDLDVMQLFEIFQGYALVEILFRELEPKEQEQKIHSLVKLVLHGITEDKTHHDFSRNKGCL